MKFVYKLQSPSPDNLKGPWRKNAFTAPWRSEELPGEKWRKWRDKALKWGWDRGRVGIDSPLSVFDRMHQWEHPENSPSRSPFCHCRCCSGEGGDGDVCVSAVRVKPASHYSFGMDRMQVGEVVWAGGHQSWPFPASENKLINFQEFREPVVKHNYLNNYVLYLQFSQLYFLKR